MAEQVYSLHSMKRKKVGYIREKHRSVAVRVDSDTKEYESKIGRFDVHDCSLKFFKIIKRTKLDVA